ncbi:MAG: hypothetical protein KBC46_05665 [Ferrovibrio sp.]|nr:hypothetical protein [Ferrovibrio sp.]
MKLQIILKYFFAGSEALEIVAGRGDCDEVIPLYRFGLLSKRSDRAPSLPYPT